MGHILTFSSGLLLLVCILKSCYAVDCGSHLTANTGFFMSPNHPKPYPPDKNCVWTITVQGSAPQIQLKFSSFDLPPPTNKVCLDYVAIYYGMLPKIENQIAKFCGSVIPSDILVKKKSLRVEFYSNGDDKTASGFKASFFANSNSGMGVLGVCGLNRSMEMAAPSAPMLGGVGLCSHSDSFVNYFTAITTSQTTAGIVAAIFCGIVFLGVGTMRCIMMGMCHRCQTETGVRECVGTDEDPVDFNMDNPPDYVTVMARPDLYPTPSASLTGTPVSTPGTSRGLVVRDVINRLSTHSNTGDEDEDEGPPPYPGIVINQPELESYSVPVQINRVSETTSRDRGQHFGQHGFGDENVQSQETEENDEIPGYTSERPYARHGNAGTSSDHASADSANDDCEINCVSGEAVRLEVDPPSGVESDRMSGDTARRNYTSADGDGVSSSGEPMTLLEETVPTWIRREETGQVCSQVTCEPSIVSIRNERETDGNVLSVWL